MRENRRACDLCLSTYDNDFIIETKVGYARDRSVYVCVECIKDLHAEKEEQGW